MANSTYLPSRDSELLGFSQNFNDKIKLAPTAYGLTAGMSTAFDLLNTSFKSAMAALDNPTTKSPPFVAAKNTAKDALIDGPGGIRALVALVQAHPGITDEQLVDLQLTVRDRQPSPIPQPSAAPTIHIGTRFGRMVQLRLEDAANPNSRARPAGVQGAAVYSWVGATPPADFTTWKSEGNFTRTEIEIEFPLTVAPSTQVWFAAAWYNPRGETGPGTTPPVTTNLDSAGLAEAA